MLSTSSVVALIWLPARASYDALAETNDEDQAPAEPVATVVT